jgi:flagellar hook-associated protein 3 FlgL
MRITSAMLHDGALANLQTNVAALEKIQQQVSSSRRIVRPSDDPADVRSAVKASDGLAGLQQFLRNITVAQRSVEAADAALNGAGEVIQRASELAIAGANSALSTQDRAGIAAEVEQLARELVGQSNAKSGDQYLFSGFKTGTPAYVEAAAGSAAVSAYGGDHGVVAARIAPGTMMTVNVTADVVFAPALAALAQLHAELVGGGLVSGGTITMIDAGQSALLAGRAQIGARANRLAETQSTLEDNVLSAQKLLSNLVDADLAGALTELTQRQSVYQAALEVNARILQPTLLDHLG